MERIACQNEQFWTKTNHLRLWVEITYALVIAQCSWINPWVMHWKLWASIVVIEEISQLILVLLILINIYLSVYVEPYYYQNDKFLSMYKWQQVKYMLKLHFEVVCY